MTARAFTAGFLFCGLGAGARGFLDAQARMGGATARFRSAGGVDIDREACRDFERLTGSLALGRTADGAGTFKGRPGLFGVIGWDEPAPSVTGAAAVSSSNMPAAVAAPRPAPPLPPGYVLLTEAEAFARVDAGEKRPPAGMIPVIASPHDGCWHRPLTTLELAALQGLPAMLDGAPLTLSAASEAGIWVREYRDEAVSP